MVSCTSYPSLLQQMCMILHLMGSSFSLNNLPCQKTKQKDQKCYLSWIFSYLVGAFPTRKVQCPHHHPSMHDQKIGHVMMEFLYSQIVC
uniref:Uncharacterized protein n=1 Tax=Arundo donax TaxID=35708 RepID=A0A0A9D2H5_ARUDO